MALSGLSRRERQIMEILYRRGKASVSDVREAMEDAPGYSAVRAMMRVLEEKGHVRHQEEGLKYVYLPVVAQGEGQEVGGEEPPGHVFQRCAGAGGGGAAGCLFPASHGGRVGSHVGND